MSIFNNQHSQHIASQLPSDTRINSDRSIIQHNLIACEPKEERPI